MTFPYNPDPLAPIRAELQALRGQQNQFGAFARQQSGKLDQLAQILGGLQGQRSGGGGSPGVIRIEDIPGRRIPFDMLVDIPIGSNTTSSQAASFTISQEGPFVATRRVATFMSSLEFQLSEEDGTVSRFSGRSYGRYRPIHSAWDLMDAQSNAPLDGWLTLVATLAIMPSGNGFPGFVSSMSDFRTMEFDGRISVLNAGSSYPRQNIPVPTSFWTEQINSPFNLGALDFFERGETMTINAAPNHVNNPPAGNAIGDYMFSAGSWPFAAGQYDQHEGIVTPEPFETFTEEDLTTITDDPLTRLPDGVMTIGYHGYRIQQPSSP